MKTAIFAFCAQPYMYHFVRREPYTVRHAILHNVGFHVGFCDQTLHTYPSDFQTLSLFCVGFVRNVCSLEKRIGVF